MTTDSTTQQPPTRTEPTQNPRAVRLFWIAFTAILIGEVLDLLDSLVTTVAGPSILRDLGGSDALLQWLSAGYTLAMAGGVLIGGRLGDRYGRRRLFLIGMAGFTLASILAAAAPTAALLLAARIAQGLLGALMLPQSMGLIRDIAGPERMRAAFGVFGVKIGPDSNSCKSVPQMPTWRMRTRISPSARTGRWRRWSRCATAGR